MPPLTNSLTVLITLFSAQSGGAILNRHITCRVLIAEVGRVSMTTNSAIDTFFESFRAAAGATSDATHEKGNDESNRNL